MKKYDLFPYKNGYCVCSCLQSILKRRGRGVPSQETIYGNFNKSKDGLHVDSEALNNFLGKYRLITKYFPPFNIIEPEIPLRENEEDIMIAYSFNILSNPNQRSVGHTSLVARFSEGTNSELLLFDGCFEDGALKSFSLSEIINSMRNINDSGFYLINNR